MNYEEQTNAELKQLCADLGLDVEAKNPSKPNKAELIKALEIYDGTYEEEVTEEPGTETAPTNKPAKLNKAQLRRKQYQDKMKLVRVMITSNAVNQTKAGSDEVQTVSWGNRVLGYQTDRYILGKPWHVRQGALDNLRNSTITIPAQNDEQNKVDWNVVPAFNIVELAPLTKEEIKTIAEKQKVRNATVEM